LTSVMVGLRLLRCLSVGVTPLSGLCRASGLGRATLSEMLWELDGKEVLKFDGEMVEVGNATRPLFAAHLRREGASLGELSSALDWKEFEDLAAEALAACGYSTIRSLRMKRPSREIDVLGVHSGFALAFDCKHWGRWSLSALAGAAVRQVERCRQYLGTHEASTMGVREVMPAILVLQDSGWDRVGGVAVVAVDKLFSFVMAAKGLTGSFVTLRL